jgi:hypothetical protein
MLRKLRRLVRMVGFGLFIAAIAQEMSKPEDERTWHGKVGGVVPYDFRPPTWDRIRAAYWNPEDDRLFTDRVFGVGWAVNLYRARELMLNGYQQLMGATAPASQRWRKRTSGATSKAAETT